jgi:hypothetical protein
VKNNISGKLIFVENPKIEVIRQILYEKPDFSDIFDHRNTQLQCCTAHLKVATHFKVIATHLKVALQL